MTKETWPQNYGIGRSLGGHLVQPSAQCRITFLTNNHQASEGKPPVQENLSLNRAACSTVRRFLRTTSLHQKINLFLVLLSGAKENKSIPSSLWQTFTSLTSATISYLSCLFCRVKLSRAFKGLVSKLCLGNLLWTCSNLWEYFFCNNSIFLYYYELGMNAIQIISCNLDSMIMHPRMSFSILAISHFWVMFMLWSTKSFESFHIYIESKPGLPLCFTLYFSYSDAEYSISPCLIPFCSVQFKTQPCI